MTSPCLPGSLPIRCPVSRVARCYGLPFDLASQRASPRWRRHSHRWRFAKSGPVRCSGPPELRSSPGAAGCVRPGADGRLVRPRPLARHRRGRPGHPDARLRPGRPRAGPPDDAPDARRRRLDHQADHGHGRACSLSRPARSSSTRRSPATCPGSPWTIPAPARSPSASC